MSDDEDDGSSTEGGSVEIEEIGGPIDVLYVTRSTSLDEPCHAPDIFRLFFSLFFPPLQDVKTYSSDYDHQNIRTPLLLQISSDYKGI